MVFTVELKTLHCIMDTNQSENVNYIPKMVFDVNL